jgi:HEAT repeat protein
MVVLFRIAERRVERLRVFSEDCRLDAGGRPVKWIDNVRPADSVALLESLAGTSGGVKDRVTNSALMAISLHADPSALDTLFRIARTGSEPRARGEALFWLAQRAGDKVAAAIRERVDQDPDTDVKKKAVFALSQLPKDQGVPLLIQVARSNANPDVRRQAMFWLGQSKDPRAVEFFAEILSK